MKIINLFLFYIFFVFLQGCTTDPYSPSELNGTPPLNAAIVKTDYEKMEELVKNGVNINQTDPLGNTALLTAVSNNDTRVVKYLLQNGAEANVQNKQDLTPLHYSVKNNNLELSSLLISSGTNIDTVNVDGVTALFSAIILGYDEIVNLLLVLGADVNQSMSNSISPIAYAIARNNPDLVKMLISYGANVNSKGSDDMTSLHFATLEAKDTTKKTITNQIIIIRSLIEAGANVNAVNTVEHTPLFQSAYFGKFEAVKLLIESGADISKGKSLLPLHAAAEKGHVNIVKYLISSGADINTTTKNGLTPLAYAANYNQLEMVDLLVSLNCDVNISSPLTIAIQQGHHEVAERLVKSKAALDKITDDQGNTPLLIAFTHNDIKAAILLVKAGANVNHVNDKGEYPLSFVYPKNGRPLNENEKKIEALLFAHGVNANYKNQTGKTAFEQYSTNVQAYMIAENKKREAQIKAEYERQVWEQEDRLAQKQKALEQRAYDIQNPKKSSFEIFATTLNSELKKGLKEVSQAKEEMLAQQRQLNADQQAYSEQVRANKEKVRRDNAQFASDRAQRIKENEALAASQMIALQQRQKEIASKNYSINQAETGSHDVVVTPNQAIENDTRTKYVAFTIEVNTDWGSDEPTKLKLRQRLNDFIAPNRLKSHCAKLFDRTSSRFMQIQDVTYEKTAANRYHGKAKALGYCEIKSYSESYRTIDWCSTRGFNFSSVYGCALTAPI
ncbi:ankyrin repeat domain-containing protein [Shewanella saliphila]|uniref:Ankyrin repeat domain-containing protein n=1 Tax=Shewanella saliphila TaxID=2282698 RepID=A0ABQ2QBK5_9GAMM|nr:ankyrin repeat domain-containing protein [Shewanella saliphila]MCL1103515.1 ankyrin repeat domain-containing protein [Shewanella saliphila]GGP70112.1 hypothetical protein GCM10009409_38440 [Shewanella saliphila]